MTSILETYIRTSKDDAEKARRDYARCKASGFVLESQTTLLCGHVAGDSLNVIIGYGDANDLNRMVEDMARRHGCRRIRFVSHRKGAERRAERFGYSVIAKVFEKEIVQ